MAYGLSSAWNSHHLFSFAYKTPIHPSKPPGTPQQLKHLSLILSTLLFSVV